MGNEKLCLAKKKCSSDRLDNSELCKRKGLEIRTRPAKEMTMKPMFESNYHIAFSDADSAGVIYFARLFDIAHKALEDLARSLNIYDQWFQNPEIAAPIVSANCNYLKPISLGELLQLRIHLAKKSDHSIAFQIEAYVGDKHCATATTVHVFIDKSTQKKTAIPENISKSLEA